MGHDLSREAALEIARRWAAADCTVALCEAEPLPLAGWHHLQIRSAARGRTFAVSEHEEWITMNRPPKGQLDLLRCP
jgi:hypothetical protein